VSRYQATYPIVTMCRLLGVSTSGYYAWRNRCQSMREQSDAVLIEQIRDCHAASHGTYGAPRIHADLAALGLTVNRKRVTRLMRKAGLRGVTRRRFVTTTLRDDTRPAPDLVDRNFTADKPNQLWVADITYLPTWAGFVYLAVVIDVFSRRVVGWSFAATLHTKVVLDALDMALRRRRPHSVIHHSDQGSQYTSIAFGKRCREADVKPSMGSVGDCYDNALAESFFATLECELLDRAKFKTHAEAKRAVFAFIEGFYNPHRRHSSLGYLSPADYERVYEADHPDQNHPATVLGPVKSRPGNADPRGHHTLPADLDRTCARQRRCHVGRNERMGSAGAEQKNGGKRADKITATGIT
jgi:putative transposase